MRPRNSPGKDLLGPPPTTATSRCTRSPMMREDSTLLVRSARRPPPDPRGERLDGRLLGLGLAPAERASSGRSPFPGARRRGTSRCRWGAQPGDRRHLGRGGGRGVRQGSGSGVGVGVGVEVGVGVGAGVQAVSRSGAREVLCPGATLRGLRQRWALPLATLWPHLLTLSPPALPTASGPAPLPFPPHRLPTAPTVPARPGLPSTLPSLRCCPHFPGTATHRCACNRAPSVPSHPLSGV